MNIKNKGDSEIISYISIILIITLVVGMIFTILIPNIEISQSKHRFENSKNYINKIDKTITELLQEPIGSSKQLTFDLTKLYLNIDSNLIEIYSIMKGDFYKDNLKVKDNRIFTYRHLQKLYAGVEYEDVNLTNSFFIQNRIVTLYFTKTDKNRIKINVEAITETPWYNKNWNYRKRISIDHNKVEGDLENFPVLISITDDDLKNYAKSDGSDILFTLGDGETKLKREIEEYDSSTGTLVAWVRIPELSSHHNTGIYIYYGNSSGREKNNKSVWDENYVLVQHLNESPANNVEGHLDSTRYGNNGTPKDFDNDINSTTDTIGKIAGADRFDGTNDYVYIVDPDNNSLDFGTENFTINIWAKKGSGIFSNDRGILYKGGNGIIGYSLTYRRSATENYVYLDLTDDLGNRTSNINGFQITDELWHNIVFIIKRSSNKVYTYLDGEQKVTTDISSITGSLSNTYNLIIGQSRNGTYLNGSIDEVCISNSARSEDWIKTEYNNQNDPNSFYTIKEQEEK